MKLKTRFSLIGLGIITFLIVTPLLVLYARGFVFDWKTHKIVETGALVVKTDPDDATIYLNGKKQSGTTPLNIRFLTPGDYQVQVERTDYQTWTKRLSIMSQLVTWVNLNRPSITLFLQKPTLEKTWVATADNVSSSRDEIVFSNGKEIDSINVNNADVKKLTDPGTITLPTIPPAATVDWQNSSGVLQLLTSHTTWELTPTQLSQIRNVSTNGSHIAAKLNSDLYSLDNSAPLLIDKNILAFTLDGDYIWYIQGNLLKRYNYQTAATQIINSTVPTATAGQIISANSQIYLILDKSLYVLNDTFEKIYDNVSTAAWDSGSNQLLFANSSEILTYNPNNDSTDLILRDLSPISEPVINSTTGYIFFANDGQIKTIELDSRDNRNIFTIAPALDNFALSSDGQTLYTFSKTQIKQYTIR